MSACGRVHDDAPSGPVASTVSPTAAPPVWKNLRSPQRCAHPSRKRKRTYALTQARSLTHTQATHTHKLTHAHTNTHTRSHSHTKSTTQQHTHAHAHAHTQQLPEDGMGEWKAEGIKQIHESRGNERRRRQKTHRGEFLTNLQSETMLSYASTCAPNRPRNPR